MGIVTGSVRVKQYKARRRNDGLDDLRLDLAQAKRNRKNRRRLELSM